MSDLDSVWSPRHSTRMATNLFPYDLWLFSGRPIYIQAGIDYVVPTEQARRALYGAAKSRGLRVVTRYVHEYDGLIFQAYAAGEPRPVLPPPPVADFSKESHKFLFCSEDECVNRLRPHDQIVGKCVEHQSD